MKYQTEHIEQVGQSQTLLAELFTYIGENYPEKDAQLRSDWRYFFQLWASQLPFARIKVFTARENDQLKGCVMALVVEHPLFITKPFTQRFVDLTNDDKAFDDYVDVILNSQ